jgi:heat shock protein HslJ
MQKKTSLAMVAAMVLVLSGCFEDKQSAAETPAAAEASELVQTAEGVVSDAVIMEGGEEKAVELGEAGGNVSDLVNHSWKLVTLRTNPILPDTHPDFTINESGAASGNSGCNSFGGRGEFGEEGRLNVYEVRSTKRACADMKKSDQEMKYVAALAHINAWSVAEGGDTLFLYDESGDELMQFKKSAAAQ